jgi:hypothetical protein
MPRFARVILLAVALCLIVSCAKSKLPVSGPHTASLDEIEKTLDHSVAHPKPTLGATLITSAVVEGSSGSFKGLTAGSSYRWKAALVLIRQGRPAEGFALRTSVKRDDAIYESFTGGGEIALLPQVGGSSTSAFIALGDWLINVDMVPNKPKGTLPLDDLRAFVNALEL